MIERIPADWRTAVASAIAAPSFRDLADFVAAERARTDTAIFPPEAQVFTALRLTPLGAVRAVILGQDPYHEAGQAHGLAFSVPPGVEPPRSLVNVLAEWQADLGLPPAVGGSLTSWARHGVLLLNTVMTVRRGEPNSHKGKGWEPFTDAIIRAVAARPEPVAFLLWGSRAQSKTRLIGRSHVVIPASHPSGYSATHGKTPFLMSRPFSTANARLATLGRPPIDWSLTDAG
jgi:uracil-DNA glycosylase